MVTGKDRAGASSTIIAGTATAGVEPHDQRQVFLLLSLSLSFGAFVFAGVQLQMIEILRGLGHSPASALFLASMIGPAQVGIRVFELLFGHRYSIMRSAVVGSLLLPIGLGLAMLAGNLFAVALVVGATRRLVANSTLDQCLSRKKDTLSGELMAEVAPVLNCVNWPAPICSRPVSVNCPEAL